jgi:hypothetical protein
VIPILSFFVISAAISGTVYDTTTQAPLQAHVRILDSDQVIVCDSTGKFMITDMVADEYILIFSHVGFKEETLTVRTFPQDTTVVDIWLKTMPIPITEVEAKGERIMTPGRRVFQKEEIELMPGAEQNVFRFVQMIPGISLASDYLGLFYVRGGELYENKVLLDNIEILAPYHYFGVGSTFISSLIEDFDLFIGAIPARYGNAVSSVLLLRSKEIGTQHHGALTLDLIEANASYSYPLSNDLSFVLAAKRNYLDFLLKQLGIVEGVLLPYFFDLQSRLNIKNHIGHFSAGGLYSRDGTDIRASFVDQTLDLQMNGSAHTGWCGWNFDASERLTFQAYAFYTDVNRYVRGENPINEDTATEDYDAHKYSAQAHSEYDAGFLSLAIGGGIGSYSIMHAGAKIEDIFYKIGALNYSLEVDTSDHYGFLYAVQRLPVLRIFDFEIGERIDWLPAIKKPTFSPRLKFICHSNPSLFLAYSQLSQTPPLEYPVQEYKALQARAISVGTEYLIHPSLICRIELYRKNYKNLIRGQSGNVFNNDGTGQVSGIELSLRRYLVGSLFGMISYAYSISERTTPYDSGIVVTDIHRPHILNFFFGNNFPQGIRLGIQLQVASGMAYRPVIGREGYTQWYPVYSPDKERLPYYQRIDIHVGKEFTIWEMRGELYLTVLNVLNHRNVQGYLYNDDYTLRRAIYMLPRIPLLGLRVEF